MTLSELGLSFFSVGFFYIILNNASFKCSIRAFNLYVESPKLHNSYFVVCTSIRILFLSQQLKYYMVSQMISQVPSNKKIPRFWEPARSTHVNTAAMSVSTNQTPRCAGSGLNRSRRNRPGGSQSKRNLWHSCSCFLVSPYSVRG